jgi:putative transposase
VRFDFIRSHARQYSVERLCRVLEVSRAGYYAWRKAQAGGGRPKSELGLRLHVRAAFRKSRGTYGSPRVHQEMRAQGLCISRKRVERLMREEKLCARRRRRFRGSTTDSAHAQPIAGNLVARQFRVETVAGVDRVWVGDITYLPTQQGWLYLAVVLDLKSRRVVGYALSASLETKLVCQALEQALRRRRPAAGLIHHSDQGRQYASSEYVELLERHGIRQSMSRKGDCWDNAVAESFFASLEWELIERSQWSTRAQAGRAVVEYVEGWYNPERRHSSLGYRSPAQYEAQLALTPRAA